MKKIPTVFERDWDGDRSRVLDRVVPGCEWVLAGEGVATRKYDGTCVMLDEKRRPWKRREVKVGQQAPPEFEPVEEDADGNVVGWVPIGEGPEDKLAREALARLWDDRAAVSWPDASPEPGTYELVGPKINKNPEGFDQHELVRHAEAAQLLDAPRDYAGLAAWFADPQARGRLIEGIVWHHPDGRMAKIKCRDFGIRRVGGR